MKPELIAPSIAAFFFLLALIFLVLSATRGTPPAKKTWRRIGAIFAAVAVFILVLRGKIT